MIQSTEADFDEKQSIKEQISTEQDLIGSYFQYSGPPILSGAALPTLTVRVSASSLQPLPCLRQKLDQNPKMLCLTALHHT